MKYSIEIGYSFEIEFRDFEEFTAAIGMLIAGGQRKMELRITDEEEVKND